MKPTPPPIPADALHGGAGLADWLRTHAFGFPAQPAGPPLIGAEVELIPVVADTGRVAPLEGAGEASGPAVLPFLRRYGAERGWVETHSEKGAPHFELPDGGALNLEPGGQVEYASPPLPSVGGLLDALDAVLQPLVEAAAGAGLRLLSVGIDPCTPLEDAPLQLAAPRYLAMDAYLATLGSNGARMMRQTAAVQVNLDPGPDPLGAWRLLNAAAPACTALFANSTHYAGVDTGHRSYRAHCWRTLDPARTGMLEGVQPAREYAAFALAAPALFLGSVREGYRPFAAYAQTGRVSPADLHAHLSTLFPEVRPRGFLEVRGFDAVPVERLPAVVVFVAGLLADARSIAEGLEAAGLPDTSLLVAAGRGGLADAEVAARAAALVDVALAGAGRLREAGRLPAVRLEAAVAELSSAVGSAAPGPPHR